MLLPRHVVRLIMEIADPTVTFHVANKLDGWRVDWCFKTYLVHVLDMTEGYWNGIRLRCVIGPGRL